MSEYDQPELETADELTALKARADLLGVSYHPSIGVEKLREKINAKLADEAPAEEAPVPGASLQESPGAKKLRLQREAMALVRVRVTCMNPQKKEWEGELFTVGNSNIRTVTKYVPFNAEDGWHIPQILLNQLQERQCQVFHSTKDEGGNTVRKGKLIKEFAIEILPPLTSAELKDLAQRQAMAKGGA